MYCIEAKKINLKYDDLNIIDNLSVRIYKNKITTLIGANGCGKSTLLKSFARLLKPEKGEVILNGKDIHKEKTINIAKELSILPQSSIEPEGLSVYELVKMGRYPHQTWLDQWSEEDEILVNKALRDTNIYELRYKAVDNLSGGQKQRVWIAMTLAQDSKVLLLDEPTTYLDLTHQIDILDLLKKLNKEYNKTIIMVLHDLNLACRYSDQLISIQDKNIFSKGSPKDTINEEMIKKVFDLNCKIINDPYFDTPLCIPLSRTITSNDE